MRLFNRTTRSVAPTEAGLRFLDRARAVLQQIEEAEKDAAGEMALPAGHLAVTASVSFGRHAVAPVVWEYLRANPRVSVSLLMLDRQVNLVEEGVDVAVRIGQLQDSSLLARAVGRVRRLLVASPDYLARRGVPAIPVDLRLHDVIGSTGLMPNREWRHVQDGWGATVRLAPRFELNDAAAARVERGFVIEWRASTGTARSTSRRASRPRRSRPPSGRSARMPSGWNGACASWASRMRPMRAPGRARPRALDR